MSALIFNTLGATFQHALRNPLKTGTSGNCPETMKVCPKNNTSKKTAQSVPRKTVAVPIAFYGKLRRKNEIPWAK